MSQYQSYIQSSLLILLSLVITNQGNANPDRPNVLFIAIDDLNDMVGFLNSHPGVSTPHLNRLAKRGLNFTNAHCAVPACAPSRTAVLTGMSAARTGIYTNKDDWRNRETTKDVVTIPDAFRSAGYHTKGGGKIYHAHTLNDQALTGFLDPVPWDEYFPSKQQQMPEEITPQQWPVHSVKKFYGGHFDWAGLEINDNEMADGQVITWAEKQLSRQHQSPLFLAVGIYRPHIPWWTPKKYFQHYPLEAIQLPEVRSDDLHDLPEAALKFPRIHWHKWIIENQQWSKAVQGYFASVSFTDALVGRLIAALDDGPMASNTIIVLWSDHGYHLGQKQHWEKFALWEQTTHVPLLFVDTRQSENNSGDSMWDNGSRCHQPVILVDIYPTLAEICQLDVPHVQDGISLVPFLNNSNHRVDRPVIITHGYQNHAVRSEHWRYIRYADGSEELYDHRHDPEEFYNLASYDKYDSIKSDHRQWLPQQNHEQQIPVKTQ